MEKESLKASIGKPAEGSDYYLERPQITRKIHRKLDEGSHLLISAPRRIGKTSILKHLTNTPRDNQIVKYLIVQSVSSQGEFFKKLFNELINDNQIYSRIDQWVNNATTALKQYVTRIKSVNLGGTIELDKEASLDYHDLIQQVFDQLSGHDQRIIIMVDEFPDALVNIHNNDAKESLQFLQRNRDLREKHSKSNIQFVYTGSTGLKNVVNKIGDIHLINDIQEVHIPPLSNAEAKELTSRLVKGKQRYLGDFELTDGVVDYLLGRISWNLPYYIQIIVEKLFDGFENHKQPINADTVETALASLVHSGSEHADYFEHWKRRLAKSFKDEEFHLAMEVLSVCATKGVIHYNEYANLEQKHNVEDKRHVLNVLGHDGYLIAAEDENTHGFNSVLLKEWWYINVVN